MPRIARPSFSLILLLLIGLAAGSQVRVGATVYRDRAAFNAAAQNLSIINFDDEPTQTYPFPGPVIDGLRFEGNFGWISVYDPGSTGNKVMVTTGVPEITALRIFFPPGTTAVACDQFTHSMLIRTSAGESVMIDDADSTSFVGFISDTPIANVTLIVDFPEPTENIVIDNLAFGQRRAENEPPVPLLLTTSNTGRAVALDSVTLLSEPFTIVAPHLLSADHHTRLTLFLAGVRFTGASDAQFVTASAEQVVGGQPRAIALPVEAVGMVRNLSWMAQVTVRLPDELSGAGDVNVSVSVRGATSNNATLRINPSGN